MLVSGCALVSFIVFSLIPYRGACNCIWGKLSSKVSVKFLGEVLGVMSQVGRPVKPLEQKRLLGTLRPDRVPANAPLITLREPLEAPRAPEGLEGVGLEFWGSVWRTPWISQTSDYWLVLMTSEALCEREALRELVLAQPDNPKARSGLRELERQLVSNLGLLGFTPSDRARLGLAEVKKESKLEALLAKKAQRELERNLETAQ